jgi:hypothetical protein
MAHLALPLNLLLESHKKAGLWENLSDGHGHPPKGVSVSVRDVRSMSGSAATPDTAGNFRTCPPYPKGDTTPGRKTKEHER